LIKEKSKEVKEAFAEEIAKMAEEKIIFLSLVYLLGDLETEKIEAIYNRVCGKLELDPKGYPFEYLEGWFQFKITRYTQDVQFEFTHPSYEEGLVRSWRNIRVQPLFFDLIGALIKEDYPVVRGWVGFYLVKNFKEMPAKEKANKLIHTILRDKSVDARNGVAEAVHAYSAELPLPTTLEYLEKMAVDSNRAIRTAVVRTVGDNLKNIPRETSLKFIAGGLEDRAAWTRLNAASLVTINLKDLPEEFAAKALNCLEKLQDYSGWTIRYFSGIYYRVLKRKLERLGTSS
jgi:hypothetical protein